MVASAIIPSFHHCSTSIGSHSGSVPYLSSVPSDSRSQSLALSISTSEVSGPSMLSKEHKALLLEYLGIDRDLSSLEPSGLCTSYQKFTGIVNVSPKSWAGARMKSGRHSFMVQLSGFQPLSPSLISSILSIPPLILARILEFCRIPGILAGIDWNLTGIDRDYPYLCYILLFYFKQMFWNWGIDQNSIMFKIFY